MVCPKKCHEYCELIDNTAGPQVCEKVCKNGLNAQRLRESRRNAQMSRSQLPPLHEQALSLGKAVVKQTLAGNPTRTGEELERVKKICNECEFFNSEQVRCIKCGCYMNVKQRWATSHCKLGKW